MEDDRGAAAHPSQGKPEPPRPVMHLLTCGQEEIKIETVPHRVMPWHALA